MEENHFLKVSRKWRGTILRSRKSKLNNRSVTLTIVYLCILSLSNLSHAIMTFPEKGVYSLFPHEDLRTGKRLRFDDDHTNNNEKYREPHPIGGLGGSDRGRDDIFTSVQHHHYHHHPHDPPPLSNVNHDLDRERDRDRDRDRPPSGEPFLVDILRPTSGGSTSDPSNVRKLTNSFESFHRGDHRNIPTNVFRLDHNPPNGGSNVDRYSNRNGNNGNGRSPRVYFDDERRVFGYGKKYEYHDELPPVSSSLSSTEDRFRETNLIRPSPVDLTNGPNYRYLPEAKLPPRAKNEDEDPPARIHLFTPHNADKFGASRNNNNNNGHRGGGGSHVHPDGPVLVDAPGPNAFLNHEEYLNFHTKIALQTLENEKKRLEDTRRKILFSPSARPVSNNGIPGGGLIPPNFSKEVTVLEESVESDERRRPGTSSSSSTESSSASEEIEEDTENNIGTTTTITSTNTNKDSSQQQGNLYHDNVKKLNSSKTKSSLSSSSPPPSSSLLTSTTTERENDKTKYNKGETSSTPSLESGFLPIVPFQLRGHEKPKPTILPLLPESGNNLSRVNNNNSLNTNDGAASSTKSPGKAGNGASTEFNLPSPSSLSSFSTSPSSSSKDGKRESDGRGNPITTTTSSSSKRPSGTNPTASTTLIASQYDDSRLKTTLPVTTVTSSPQKNSASSSTFSSSTERNGGRKKIVSISSIPASHGSKVKQGDVNGRPRQQQKPSPFVFVDSSEVPSSFNLSMPQHHQNQQSQSSSSSSSSSAARQPSQDKMMIYVQRVKAPTARKQQPAIAGGSFSSASGGEEKRHKIQSTVSVHESQTNFAFDTHDDNYKDGGGRPQLEFYPVKYNESGDGGGDDAQVLATTKNGVNSGVVAKVHAHISNCPKLYGSVEVICDVYVRERHGHPNPQLIVGWLRKFYNETKVDKVLAVNKTLAYEEDFHDKFNVTLAPGISPMLRSVLIIRQVTAPDCGNYQCEVFDGVSTHKSETLLFLCH